MWGSYWNQAYWNKAYWPRTVTSGGTTHSSFRGAGWRAQLLQAMLEGKRKRLQSDQLVRQQARRELAAKTILDIEMKYQRSQIVQAAFSTLIAEI